MSGVAPPSGLLAAQWASFRNLAPAGTPEAVLREFRKAFYCGAIAMLDVLLQEMAPGGDATAHDEAVVDGLRAEFEAFLAERTSAGQA